MSMFVVEAAGAGMPVTVQRNRRSLPAARA
jgi:hypothetical protein